MTENFVGPLFIVGVPRSGTKLLRELLARNERVRIPRTESEFFPELAAFVARQGGDLRAPGLFEQMYDWSMRFPYFRYARRRGELISLRDWRESCRSWDAAGVFEALIRHDAGAAFGSATIWGDKSPSYLTCIGDLAQHFPTMRVIHIVRDVRDQVLSSNDAWGKDMYRAAQRWSDDVGLGMTAGRKIGSRYTWMKYEELTAEPEAVLRRLCAFIGIDFDASMLTLDRASENLGAARDVRGILESNTGKFRARLTERQISVIEAIAGARGAELGYEMTTPRQPIRLSRASMTLRQGMDAARLVLKRSRTAGLLESTIFHLRYRQATSGRNRGKD